MTIGQPIPPTATVVHQDGLERAMRSVVGGVLTAALTAGGAGLLAAIGTVQWTPNYWKVLGGLALSSLLYGVVSYGMRRFAPPAA